ncbi:MAG: hypothetical protein SFU91_11685 [Chloroherpetonaceae bacterium]|nr:hypothetical protein [Chloroherpetonaceae bacterium]
MFYGLFKFFLLALLTILFCNQYPLNCNAQTVDNSSQIKKQLPENFASLISELSFSGSGYYVPSFMKYSENLLSRRAPDLLFGLDLEGSFKLRIWEFLFIGPATHFFIPDASNLTTVSNEQQLKLTGWAFGLGGSIFSREALASNSFSGFNFSIMYSMPRISQTQFIGQETFDSNGIIVSLGAMIGFPLATHFNTTLGLRVRGGFGSLFKKNGNTLEYSDNDGSIHAVRFNFLSIGLQLGLLYDQ